MSDVKSLREEFADVQQYLPELVTKTQAEEAADYVDGVGILKDGQTLYLWSGLVKGQVEAFVFAATEIKELSREPTGKNAELLSRLQMDFASRAQNNGGRAFISKPLIAKTTAQIELLKKTGEYRALLSKCADPELDVKVEIKKNEPGDASAYSMVITLDKPFSHSPDRAFTGWAIPTL